MDYTIEQPFFDAYQRLGLFGKSIKWICLKNGLIEDENKKETLHSEEMFIRQEMKKNEKLYLIFLMRDYYNPLESDLMKEIERNIIECKNDEVHLSMYINYILRHFETLSDLRKDVDFFNRFSAIPTSYHVDKEPAYTGYRRLAIYAEDFTEYFDLLLLKHGINLLWYQEEIGIYLWKKRETEKLVKYFGSWKILEDAIARAKPKLIQESPLELKLPEEIDNSRAQKYFKKAIECGFMEVTESGIKWLYGGDKGKVRCAYFLTKVYRPTNTEHLPMKALQTIFNIDRLDSVVNKFFNTNQEQKWIDQIDNLFED